MNEYFSTHFQTFNTSNENCAFEFAQKALINSFRLCLIIVYIWRFCFNQAFIRMVMLSSVTPISLILRPFITYRKVSFCIDCLVVCSFVCLFARILCFYPSLTFFVTYKYSKRFLQKLAPRWSQVLLWLKSPSTMAYPSLLLNEPFSSFGKYEPADTIYINSIQAEVLL